MGRPRAHLQVARSDREGATGADRRLADHDLGAPPPAATAPVAERLAGRRPAQVPARLVDAAAGAGHIQRAGAEREREAAGAGSELVDRKALAAGIGDPVGVAADEPQLGGGLAGSGLPRHVEAVADPPRRGAVRIAEPQVPGLVVTRLAAPAAGVGGA